MSPDLSCECGGRLFGATPVFQTMPNGRVFELASSSGEVKNVWVMKCLSCPEWFVMDKRPDKEHGNTLLRAGSPEANALLERYTTDGVFSDVDDVEVPQK